MRLAGGRKQRFGVEAFLEVSKFVKMEPQRHGGTLKTQRNSPCYSVSLCRCGSTFSIKLLSAIK